MSLLTWYNFSCQSLRRWFWVFNPRPRDVQRASSFALEGLEDRTLLSVAVEVSVKIAHGVSNGPTLSNGDLFGASMAAIGDLNGDGVGDLVVGASKDDTSGTDRGAVHVLFMNANGSVKSKAKIAHGTANLPSLLSYGRFGASVTALGDIDGDGVVDIAVGANRDNTGGNARGAVYIVRLNSNGSVKAATKIASGTANAPSISTFDYFGRSVAGLGDLDGDGVEDVAVGASGSDTGGTARGVLHILFLNSNGTVKSSTTIGSGTANGPTLSNFDYFGRSAASLGDVDGDGVTDLAVGSVNRGDAGGSFRGAVHVLFLNANGSVKSSAKIDGNTANGPVLANSDEFGSSAAGLGDIDGDGVPDLAVGATGDGTGNFGAVHVLNLNSNGTVKETSEIANGTPNGPVLQNDHYFGSSVALAGDLDGDGGLELAVGASGDDTGGESRGAIHILNLAPMGGGEDLVIFDPATGRWRAGFGVGNSFTWFNGPKWNPASGWTTFTGDYNGDGLTDGIGITSSNQVFVARNNGDGTATTVSAGSFSSQESFQNMLIGDFNGDGRDDLIVQQATNNTTPLPGSWFVKSFNGSSFQTSFFGRWEATGWADFGVGDVNQDGVDDIIGVRNAALGVDRVNWLYGVSNVIPDTSRRFFAQFAGAFSGRIETAGWHSVLVGDWDDDGRADVAARKSDGRFVYGTATGGPTPFVPIGANRLINSTGPLFSPSFFGGPFHVGDFNNDGRDDILTRQDNAKNLWVAQTNASSPTSSTAQLWGAWNDTLNWSGAAVGDFDGDGTDDYVSVDLTNSHAWIARSSGSSFMPVSDFGFISGPETLVGPLKLDAGLLD